MGTYSELPLIPSVDLDKEASRITKDEALKREIVERKLSEEYEKLFDRPLHFRDPMRILMRLEQRAHDRGTTLTLEVTQFTASFKRTRSK